jgi:drug/metabolite transporter (DMT)-like permease
MTKTDKLLTKPMTWYHYIAAFFAGVFFTNAIPHYVNGLSGNPFPTPFADPPIQGLSSPLINILWALFNLLAGYLFFRVSRVNSNRKLGLFIFFSGITFISILFGILYMGMESK